MTGPTFCRLAVALLAGCGRSGSPPAQTPAPDDTVSQRSAGAVTSIFPTEADARVERVEELLRARVPGLEVISRSDGNYALRIRGHHAIMGDPAADEPLLVIDEVSVPPGSLGSALAGLAPGDVARIDVLKDAAATALYGSRGANGVIIITTKRAR
jgi:TonB-dependent starch-binding outer membrane protein SusC